jgi:predicted acylesterase/phospholipase RssA
MDEPITTEEKVYINIEELVISGGGVKGYAYLSAIVELYNLKLLNNLKIISCVSIGCVLAIIIALKYNLEDFQEYVFNYDISKLKDMDFIGFIKRKSFLKGDEYRIFAKNVLSFNGEDYSNMTLLELYNKSSIKLIIAVACVNTMTLEHIDHINHPDLSLLNVMLMSTSIPGILPPVKLDSKYYIDGAIIDNTPVSVLSKNAWGIRQCSKNKAINIEIKNSFDFFATIIHMKVNTNNEYDPEKYNHWIDIVTNNIKATSFDLNVDTKLTLISNGRDAVRKLLKLP